MSRNVPVAKRFWPKVSRDIGNRCWQWLGATNRGYGRFRILGKQAMAHRVAWELTNGPISDEMTIDHLCFNRGCVNPSHLDVVSRGDNSRRYTSTIVQCPNGHLYDESNTRTDIKGRRHCRACNRARWHLAGKVQRTYRAGGAK